MKYKFETEDEKEALCLLKSEKMSCLIHDFLYNGLRKFKHRDVEATAEELMDVFIKMMEECGINIDEQLE